MDQSDIADDVIATAEPLEISPPSKFARRFIAARWVNVCSQCERPLPGHRWGNKKYNRRYGLAKFFCPGGYCQARYFGRLSNGEAEPTENVPSVPETPVLPPLLRSVLTQ
jgi:hypothetical protein